MNEQSIWHIELELHSSSGQDKYVIVATTLEVAIKNGRKLFGDFTKIKSILEDPQKVWVNYEKLADKEQCQPK